MAKKVAKECSTVGEKCLHYLAHMNDMRDYRDDEVFKDFFRKAEIAAFTPEKKDQYIAEMITERDYENILYTANLMGMEKGEEKGIAKGKAEAKIETAKNIKAKGISDEIICECTGLSPELVATHKQIWHPSGTAQST